MDTLLPLRETVHAKLMKGGEVNIWFFGSCFYDI